MKTRILSALIMLPLLVLVFIGGRPLLIACFLVGVLGVREFYKSFESIDIKPSHGVANISILMLYGIQLFFAQEHVLYMLWLFITVILSMLYLFKINQRKLEDSMVTIVGIVYIVFFSYHVVLIDQLQHFSILVWLVLITAFGTDIMAYFSGYLLGKHKLCPDISPKKTIEGSIGGTLGSIVFSGIFGYFVCPQWLIHCLIIGLLGGIMSQLGDLTASIFKRKIGIKDYGNLIPGHGGILDRFDSVLFTAPTVFYYIVIASTIGFM